MHGHCTNSYTAVVDDDERICRSQSRPTRASGIHAINCSSAEQFLEDTKHPRLDRLVLHNRLMKKCGIEFQQGLAASGDTTPVLFITAYDGPGARDQAERPGCVAYFRKTAPGEQILSTVRRAVIGTTRIGRFVHFHTFMLPALIATATVVLIGLLISTVYVTILGAHGVRVAGNTKSTAGEGCLPMNHESRSRHRCLDYAQR